MRLLVDTVIFIWAVQSPERISKKGMAALSNKEVIREMSVISLTEIATKQSTGKLTFDKDDVLVGIADLKLRILPYTLSHACYLFGLPPHHKDPFDRQIIAQALAENIPIVTCDDKFKLYKGLKVIW